MNLRMIDTFSGRQRRGPPGGDGAADAGAGVARTTQPSNPDLGYDRFMGDQAQGEVNFLGFFMPITSTPVGPSPHAPIDGAESLMASRASSSAMRLVAWRRMVLWLR